MEKVTLSTQIGGPEDLWRWDVFGDSMLIVIHTKYDIPWTRRVLCKIFLGSKFTDLRKEKKNEC